MTQTMESVQLIPKETGGVAYQVRYLGANQLPSPQVKKLIAKVHAQNLAMIISPDDTLLLTIKPY